jgi:UPF0755 protein
MTEPRKRSSAPPRKRAPARKRKSDPDEPRARSRAGVVVKWVLTIVACAALVGVGAFLFFYPATHGPGGGRDVELVVPGDESPDALADRLASAGLVASPRLFAVYVRISGGASSVARGTHLLTDDLSPRDLLARLERSTAAGRVKVTFPEGWTRFDMARRLQEKHVCPLRSFLDATAEAPFLSELRIEGPTAEGYLFPATYDFAPDSDAHDVVRRMKAELDKRYAIAEQRHQSGLLDLTQTLGWGMRQILTLASMIEKEAVHDDERPIIASVFLNRMRDPSFTPKLLQCDPTAGYGCLIAPGDIPSCATYMGKITHDIVADAANPYNTYKHEGLPPGPIASPGLRSIEAVMAPAATRYFYFVARGEGRHTFSETYAGHTSAVRGANKP